MSDLINLQLLKAIQRKKTSSAVLLRFFRVHFRITLSEEVLLKRISSLR